MTAPAPPLTDRAAFLNAVAAAGLLSPGQLTKAAAAVPPAAATAARVADALVHAGFLTRFQADRLLAGRTDGFVLGQYVILEQVGRGAMARVYKAKHRAMNRPVAVKVLSPVLTGTPTTRRAFDREVRAAAQLNHPNVVTAYDANEVGDRSYLVLEYVDGPTLDALVRQCGPLPVPQACDFVRQAAWGLQHAHDRGLVHRDVKPTNLLVARPSAASPACVLKIADFGLAKLTADPAAGGRFLGTADYVAPEQAADPDRADPRADLYSLGCTFYFLLAGRPPFPDGTPAEKVRRHRTEEPVRIDRLRPDVPPAVAAVVHTLMAKDPAARFRSAADLARALGVPAAVCVPGYGPDAGVVNYDLPPPQPGPHSFAGYLTGMHPQPAADTSPWAQLTADAAAPTVEANLELTPVAPARPKAKLPAPARRRASAWPVLLLCLGLVLASAAGLMQVLRMLGK